MSENLEQRVQELEAEIRTLEKDLIHDHLTGLKTRAFFEEELGIYLSAISQEQGKRKEWFGFKHVSIIFADIDHFKKINDTYGHDVGDMVLREVALAIRQDLRTGDTVARWGGEEIVISLLGADESDARAKANRIRDLVKELRFKDFADLRVTISMGLASSEKGITVRDLVLRADKALYEAKSGGRDKVVTYSELTK